MNRGIDLRTFVVVALLLPGLAIAAPIAGPCGLCESGMSCPSMETAKAEAETGSCCGGEAEKAPAAPSLGSSDCDCGRQAPLATAVEASPTHQTAMVEAPRDAADAVDLKTDAVVARAANESPPPPFPPVFLIDCAFLT